MINHQQIHGIYKNGWVYSSGGSNNNAFIASIRNAVPELLKLAMEALESREVLNEIKRVRFGLDLNDSQEEQLDYWANTCFSYRKLASAHLNKYVKSGADE